MVKSGNVGDIRKIKGVGERLYHKIMSSFGGESEFLRAAQNYEVDRISEIDGVSQRKAVEIVKLKGHARKNEGISSMIRE